MITVGIIGWIALVVIGIQFQRALSKSRRSELWPTSNHRNVFAHTAPSADGGSSDTTKASHTKPCGGVTDATESAMPFCEKRSHDDE